jgi:hypothetical protein
MKGNNINNSSIKVNNTPGPSSNMLTSIIKGILIAILSFLIISEVMNFIFLKGFENPVAFCLFKLTLYCFFLVIIKYSDGAMLTQLYDINEKIVSQLEDVKKIVNKKDFSNRQIPIPIIISSADDEDESNKQ